MGIATLATHRLWSIILHLRWHARNEIQLCLASTHMMSKNSSSYTSKNCKDLTADCGWEFIKKRLDLPSTMRQWTVQYRTIETGGATYSSKPR